MTPQRFHCIQVGRIPGQMFQEDITPPCGPGFDQPRAMRLKIVEQHDQWRTDMASQLLQKLQHLRTANRFFRVQLDIGAESPPQRRDGDSANGRHFAGMPRAMHKLRRLPNWRPGPTHQWRQQQPAFVDKGKMGIVTARFFLIRGQSRAIQRWTASWSRSRARNCGFWQVNPSALSKQER